MFDPLPLFRRQGADPFQGRSKLGSAHLVHLFSELTDNWNRCETRNPVPVCTDLLGDDRLRRGNVLFATLDVRGSGSPKVVEIIEKDIVELSDRGLDVPR